MVELRFAGSDGSAAVRSVNAQAQAGKGIGWWTNWNAHKLTDAELSRLRTERRTRAIVIQSQYLYGLGGSNRFTGNPGEVGTGTEWASQRQLRDTNFVARAKAAGIDVFLGFYAANWYNGRFGRSPFRPWADDAAWDTVVLPALAGLAGAAKLYGAKGLAFDGEDYPGENGSRHTWQVGTDAALHAKVRQRGQQAMGALAGAFPGVELLNYYFRFPGSFDELVRRACAGQSVDWSKEAFAPFYLGMMETAGWGRMEFWDAWFYKDAATCQASGLANWDDLNAMVAEAVKRFFDYFRPRVSASALAKLAYANFSWINGTGAATPSYPFDDPVTVEMARALLTAARDVGGSRYLPNYANPGIQPVDGQFNYTNGAPGGKSYLPVFQEVASWR